MANNASLNETIRVSDEALGVVLSSLSEEGNPEELALWIEVSGTESENFLYDVYFQELRDAADDDMVVKSGALSVVVPKSSSPQLKGSILDLGSDGGLVIINPNSPPKPEGADLPQFDEDSLSSDVAKRVIAILADEINPSIAAHGGRADLVGVADNIAYLRLGGGCQGCGQASVTLSQGIEVAIKEGVPEIVDVRDVTDHAGGSNPYYQPAKK